MPRDRSLEEASADSLTQKTQRLMDEFEARCRTFQRLEDEGKTTPTFQVKPTNLSKITAESTEERQKRHLRLEFHERLNAAAGMYGELDVDKHVVAKDLTEHAGYFARTARVALKSERIEAFRDITIIARTEDDLRTLPKPSDPAAERLCVYDSERNKCYDYRDYPNRAKGKSIKTDGTRLVRAGKDEDSYLVMLSPADFRAEMQKFPDNVEMVVRSSIPEDLINRFLERINEKINPPAACARDNDRHPPQR